MRLRPRQERAEGGAALVEFALIIPIFLALLFGIIELGVSFHKRIVMDDAVQAGGAIGAALGNDIDTDLAILEVIAEGASDLGGNGVGTLRYVEIFRVDAAGNPTGGVNFYRYDYDPDPAVCDWNPCPQGTSPVNYNGWAWSPADRDVAVGTLDTIGIKVFFAHSWITGLVPWDDRVCTPASMRDTNCFVEETTMRLEPLQFNIGG